MSRPARPILKRNAESAPFSSSTSTSSSYSSSPSSRPSSYRSFSTSASPPKVHFPPSTSLTSTYTAYSAAVYDRSPIVVAPNACAMPERGCPGRTYVLNEKFVVYGHGGQGVSPPPSPSNYTPAQWGKGRRAGSPARVRVVGFDVMGRYRSVECSDRDDGDAGTRQRNLNTSHPKPTRTMPNPSSRPPPLVHDDASSESEGDDSDGFIARISGSLDAMSISHSPPPSRKSRPPSAVVRTSGSRRRPGTRETPSTFRSYETEDDACLGGF